MQTFHDVIGAFCYADHCPHKRQQSYLMCTQHWAMVPPELQRRVLRAMGRYARNPKATGAKSTLREVMALARNAVAAVELAAERSRVEAARLVRR